MATQVEFDPTDLEGQQERAEERQRRTIIAAHERRDDLVWLLSGRRGRRQVRRQLREAGFDITSDEVRTVFNPHHGQMCFAEGLRTRGMQMVWPILRLVASGDIPLESLQKLMSETD